MDKRIEARIINSVAKRAINKLLREHYNISIRYSNNRRLVVSSKNPITVERGYSFNYETNMIGVINDIDLLKMLGDRSMERIGEGVGGDGWNNYAPDIKVSDEHLNEIANLMMVSRLSK